MRPVTCTPSSLLYCESSGVFFQVNIFLNMLQPNLQAEDWDQEDTNLKATELNQASCLKSYLVCPFSPETLNLPHRSGKRKSNCPKVNFGLRF